MTLTESKKPLWLKYKNEIIDSCCKALDITLFEKQERILKDTRRFQIIRASRRTGKTLSAALYAYCILFFSGLVNKAVHIAIGAPTTEASARVWKYLHMFLEIEPIYNADPTKGFPGLKITFDNFYSKSTNKKKMTFTNGSTIITASNDDYATKDIRGENFDLIIWDEFGQCPNKEGALEASIPALEDTGDLGELFIIGSPDLTIGTTFDHLFALGEKENVKIKSWHLEQSENPHLDRDDDLARAVLTKSGYNREKEGQPSPIGQPMFEDIFNKDTQVKTDLEYDPQHPYYCGIDFGPTNCMVIFFQYVNEEVLVLNESHIKNSTIPTVIANINLMVASIFNNTPPVHIGVDPSGKNRNDVVTYTAYSELKAAYPQTICIRGGQLSLKINQVNMLKTLMLQNRFYVSTKCKQLLRSIYMATTNPSNGGWKKEKDIDHSLDSLAYGLINFKPIADLMIKSKPKSIGFTSESMQSIINNSWR